MTFRLLHSADWHIGKVFGGFPSDIAALLREARLNAVTRLAEAARAHGAQHIVVAGDVFDSPGLPDRVLRKSPVAAEVGGRSAMVSDAWQS